MKSTKSTKFVQLSHPFYTNNYDDDLDVPVKGSTPGKASETLFSILKPYLITLRVLWQFPYKFSKTEEGKGNLAFSFTSAPLIYSILFFVLSFGMVLVLGNSGDGDFTRDMGFSLDFLLYTSQGSTYYLGHLLVISESIWSRGAFLRFWNHSESLFQVVCSGDGYKKPLRAKFTRYIIAFFMLDALQISTIEASVAAASPSNYALTLAFFVLNFAATSYFLQTLLVIYFLELFLSILGRIREDLKELLDSMERCRLEEGMETRNKQSGEEGAAEFSVLAGKYEQCLELLEEFNSCFGFRLLVQTGMYIFFLLLVAYFFIFSFAPSSDPRLTDVARTQLPTVGLYVFLIYFPCHLCTAVQEQALSLADVIKVKHVKKFRSTSSKCELQLFLTKVISSPVQISPCGFFTLNRRFITSVMATVTTYFIVLAQFKLHP